MEHGSRKGQQKLSRQEAETLKLGNAADLLPGQNLAGLRVACGWMAECGEAVQAKQTSMMPRSYPVGSTP